jgi:hypothetical protein
MRTTIVLALLLGLTGCAGKRAASDSDDHGTREARGSPLDDTPAVSHDITGAWELVSIFENGEERPYKGEVRRTVTFADNKYMAFGPRRAPSQGEYATAPGTPFATIDFLGVGRTTKGIYAVRDGILLIFTFKTQSVRPRTMDRTPDAMIQTYRRAVE